jgi:DNA polymerase-1
MSSRFDYSDVLVEVFNRLDRASEVVVDVETSGLSPLRNHIVGYALCFGPAPQDSYYLPVRHAPGGNFTDIPAPQTADGWDGTTPLWERQLLDRLNRQNLRVVGHNLNFDLKMMWRAGYQCLRSRYEDTQLNAALLNEWQGKFSLKACAGIAGVQAKLSDEISAHIQAQFPDENLPEKGIMAHYWRLNGADPVAVDYARGDGTTTWQLAQWQRERLEKEQLLKVWDIECRLIPVLVRQTMFGVRIDEERLHGLQTEITAKIDGLMSKFPEGFNVRSPGCVRAWCEAHGNTDWPLTPKKQQPSFPESWLETHDAGRAIVELRQMQTLMSSFIRPMMETHLFKGRVHTTFNQLRGDDYGTITGRLSSSDPNLQQIPHHSNPALGALFRSIFVPDEGKMWAERDYSQAEPRLLAYYSRCAVLLDDYRNNPKADAHAAVARATGLDRQTGKRVNQTLLTGGGKGVLTTKYKITPEDAKKVWNDYFERLPEIKTLQTESRLKMRRRGYVRTLLGRKCRLLDFNKAYVSMNRLLQGGNADITKYKMVQVDEYLASEGRPIEVLLSIHDSLNFQFSEEYRHIYERCGEIMADFSSGQLIELDVPMKTDAGEGKNWAEATYGEKK